MVVREHLARLGPVADAVRGIQDTVAELRGRVEARQDVERRIAESIRRLELVIAGTSARGAAGENILDVVFSSLPTEWQERDFRVGGGIVEFALRLPNSLVLPIDSKWTGAELIERLAAAAEEQERRRIRDQLNATVLERTRELRKYIDPDLTIGFGVAAVPDAVYELCAETRTAALRDKVVLVSYSMFLPYLMLVVQAAIKMGRNVDAHRLDAQLSAAEASLSAIQRELNNRMAQAITMLTNSRGDISAQTAKAIASINALRSTPDETDAAPPEGAEADRSA
jgi:DNA recombination protein RmuC